MSTKKTKAHIRTEATQTYWAISQAWRRADIAPKRFTVEQALSGLSTVSLHCGPQRKVSYLALGLVKEIVHRQKEPYKDKVVTIPLKAR